MSYINIKAKIFELDNCLYIASQLTDFPKEKLCHIKDVTDNWAETYDGHMLGRMTPSLFAYLLGKCNEPPSDMIVFEKPAKAD